jgi:hypothetical protein
MSQETLKFVKKINTPEHGLLGVHITSDTGQSNVSRSYPAFVVWFVRIQ